MTDDPYPSIELVPIGMIRTGFATLDQCPRASRLNQAECAVELRPEYADGLLDIEAATHLVLLYWLTLADRAVLHRQTPLDDVTRGVFAIRSPQRPNPIGLSVVRLLGCELPEGESPRLRVSGLDCLDGTPLIDIKPYVPAADCVSEARIAWMKE